MGLYYGFYIGFLLGFYSNRCFFGGKLLMLKNKNF